MAVSSLKYIAPKPALKEKINKNIPIKNSITFPNEEYDLVADNKDTIDLYVVIRSNKKLILDEFAMADEEFITDERYKNFDELLRFIKDKTFTSLRIVTKHRL